MSLSTSGAGAAPTRPDPEAAQRRRGRWQALGLLAVCAAPAVAALLAYYVWPPQGRVNYGDLIEARPLPAVALTTPTGKPFALGDLRGKWVMVLADDGACGDACRKNLFNMRQVRLAQGKEMERIERVWLVLDDAAPPADTARLTEGVHLARAAGSVLPQGLPGAANVRDHVFLVDPLGNLMFRFPKDADPSRMIKDVARLLKASRVG